MIGKLDRTIGRLVAAGRWLVIPIVLLLFLQWPLRDGVKAWSREANDLGQCFFALFVALSTQLGAAPAVASKPAPPDSRKPDIFIVPRVKDEIRAPRL